MSQESKETATELAAETPDALRRQFLLKFGKYAASAPAVTFTLMSAASSKAIASGATEGGGGFAQILQTHSPEEIEQILREHGFH